MCNEVKTINCSDASELFNPFFSGKYHGNHLYRGQGDASLSLTPGIARGDFDDEDAEGGPSKILIYEFELLRDFIRGCDQAGVSIPNDGHELRRGLKLVDERMPVPFGMKFGENIGDFSEGNGDRPGNHWPLRDDYALMVMAQHHGVPTRLLDWTKSPYAAMYFASVSGMKYLADKKEENGKCIAVWVIDGKEINSQSSSASFCVINAPSSLSVNIQPQQGCFTVKTSAGCSRESYELDKQEELVPFIHKYVMPVQYSVALFGLCLEHDYSAAKLFPGPDGAAQHAKEITMFRRLRRLGF